MSTDGKDETKTLTPEQIANWRKLFNVPPTNLRTESKMNKNSTTNILRPYEDSEHEGNSAKYHTGKQCIVPDCTRPAGTAWSPYWCFQCNVERLKRIDIQFKNLCNQRKV